MAEQYYTVPEDPKYDEKIRRIQNSDPVNADVIINPVIEALMRNTAAVKAEAVKSQGTAIDNHNKSSDSHSDLRKEISDAKAAAGTAQASVGAQVATHNQAPDSHSDIRAEIAKALAAASTAQTAADGRPQLQTGTYVGTANGYEDGSQTIYLSFVPKLVFVIPRGGAIFTSGTGGQYTWGGLALTDNPATNNAGSQLGHKDSKTAMEISGSSFIVYNNGHTAELNHNQYTYHFFALG